jgi:hypothetical protein
MPIGSKLRGFCVLHINFGFGFFAVLEMELKKNSKFPNLESDNV